jgi:serine/threonine-protein kinase
MNDGDTLAPDDAADAGGPPARAREEPPDEPTRIGAYLVLRKLGQGGMGVVYAAYHEGLDRKVALKLVHREADRPASRRAIVREAQALARLSHPNVVQLYEVGAHGEQVFVAMELVQGPTLGAWQRAPGRRLRELVDAYRQAAMGLRAAHQAGLVHRDFKPANAIVGADGRVRVLDFGLARAGPAAAAALEETPAPRGWFETQGALAGTPAYMSPEQLEGRPLDARSDIFALCVALWEALYGERPFAGESVDELRASIGAGRPRPAPAGVHLPERLRHALTRGLARDPADRWSTLDPVIEALAFDPDADPSAALRERRIFFGLSIGLNAVIVVPLLIYGATRTQLERRIIHLVILVGALVVLSGAAALFRRTMLRNLYHRRMMLFSGGLLALLTAQRAVVLRFDAPPRLALFDTALTAIGMCLVGAIFFARWMLIPATMIVLAIVVGAVAPQVFPLGMAVIGPACTLTIGYFWRRDARQGIDART